MKWNVLVEGYKLLKRVKSWIGMARFEITRCEYKTAGVDVNGVSEMYHLAVKLEGADPRNAREFHAPSVKDLARDFYDSGKRFDFDNDVVQGGGSFVRKVRNFESPTSYTVHSEVDSDVLAEFYEALVMRHWL